MSTEERISRPHPLKLALVAAALIASSSISAWAEGVAVKLSGGEEVPPVTTAATGGGTITVNPDMTVSGKVTTTGVMGTMAHIHQGAAGSNGPVLIPLDKDGEHGWAVPAGAKLTDAQYKAFKSGDLYVNVHSAEHKGGEIRGQLRPSAASPSPMSSY